MKLTASTASCRQVVPYNSRQSSRRARSNEMTRHFDLDRSTTMNYAAQRLPPQIKSPEHVTLINACNRPLPFFLDTIDSWEVCKSIYSPYHTIVY
jgi:hypothetical protein